MGAMALGPNGETVDQIALVRYAKVEAFTHVSIDPATINVHGGSIALGHPLGATGAALLGTALDQLERRTLSTALITLCIGGGQGIVAIIERV